MLSFHFIKVMAMAQKFTLFSDAFSVSFFNALESVAEG
jgi:hypothetical protein